MLLDALKDFNWYNEPENVRFNDDGMVINVKNTTDFWQNNAHGVHKDNGHFFFASQAGDFDLTIKWRNLIQVPFSQSGLMLRLDSMNWAKIGFLSADSANPQIGTVVTNSGFADWAVSELSEYPETMVYRARRRQGDVCFYYSLDGISFRQIRLFRFIENPLIIKVGAYACNPGAENFSCVLEGIELVAKKIASNATKGMGGY